MSQPVDVDALRSLGVRLAILFGSRSRGQARPGSDTDIGIVIEGEVPGLMDARRSMIAAAIGIASEIDLVFLAEADPLLLYEVATTGTPILQSDEGAFEEFRVGAVKRYYDTAWIRRIEAESLKKRFG